MLEQCLIWYARRFPLVRGKLRVVNALWPLAAGGGDTQRTASLIHGGFKAPCDLRDMLQRQFYFFGTYYLERELLQRWGALARTAQMVFDVGANAGIYSLIALAANPAARVHAFEPTPEIAARLRATAALNGLAGLHVEQTAVSDRSGEANLIRFRGEDDSNDGMNYIRTEATDLPCERVSTQSLDVFCAAAGIERIDLMKIDIQGNEATALRGAAGLLRRAAIRIIFLELNWAGDPSKCPATDSVRLLEDAGYRFSAPGPELIWRPPGPWLRSMSDVIACNCLSYVASD